MDTNTLDRKLGWNGSSTTTSGAAQIHPAGNASRALSTQAATFYTLAPIVGIVIVAVVVIGYVQRIGG